MIIQNAFNVNRKYIKNHNYLTKYKKYFPLIKILKIPKQVGEFWLIFWYNSKMRRILRKKDNQIALEFISDLKFTEFCVLVFSYIKNVLNIGDDNFFQVELSLREVINNAIIHGNKSDPNRRVYVKFKWNKKRLILVIKDENPEKVDFSEINKRLQSNDLLSYNGRGIMIMKSYMDKVKFIPSEHGTEIVMEKYL
jgi:anti-sigma regulatory factor (Ser/Thr protein kinase)